MRPTSESAGTQPVDSEHAASRCRSGSTILRLENAGPADIARRRPPYVRFWETRNEKRACSTSLIQATLESPQPDSGGTDDRQPACEVHRCDPGNTLAHKRKGGSPAGRIAAKENHSRTALATHVSDPFYRASAIFDRQWMRLPQRLDPPRRRVPRPRLCRCRVPLRKFGRQLDRKVLVELEPHAGLMGTSFSSCASSAA